MQVDRVLLSEKLLINILPAAEEGLLVLSIEFNFQFICEQFVKYNANLRNFRSKVSLCCIRVFFSFKWFINRLAHMFLNNFASSWVHSDELCDIIYFALIDHKLATIFLVEVVHFVVVCKLYHFLAHCLGFDQD